MNQFNGLQIRRVEFEAGFGIKLRKMNKTKVYFEIPSSDGLAIFHQFIGGDEGNSFTTYTT